MSGGIAIPWEGPLSSACAGRCVQARENGVADACAAGSGEGEGVGERGRELRLQGGAQQAPCPVQARLHRLRAQLEQGRRLLDIELLDVAHDEDEAEMLGQTVDRLLEEEADLLLCGGAFRIPLARLRIRA